MRRSSTSNRLLAAHVGGLAAVDVDVAPAAREPIEDPASGIEAGRGVGLVGRQERAPDFGLDRARWGRGLAVGHRRFPDARQLGGGVGGETAHAQLGGLALELGDERAHRREALVGIGQQAA